MLGRFAQLARSAVIRRRPGRGGAPSKERGAGRRGPTAAQRRRRAVLLRAGALAGGLAALLGLGSWLWSTLSAPAGERLEVGAGDPLPRLLEEIEAGARPAGWIIVPEGVELRAEPTAESAAAGQLRGGVPVSIRREEGGWAHVQAYPEGPAGWIPSRTIGTAEQVLSAPRPPSP